MLYIVTIEEKIIQVEKKRMIYLTRMCSIVRFCN